MKKATGVRSDRAVKYGNVAILGGPDPVIAEDAVIAHALAILTKRHCKRNGASFADPDASARYFTLRLAGQSREVFAVAFLNNRHQLIACEHMFYGTVDGCQVMPREVLRRALELNAAAVVLAHNHPSGECEPSGADRTITAQIRDVLNLCEIRTLDHIVVGAGRWVSFAQRGWM